MKVHLFGAVSSPGCVNYGLKQLAKKHSYIYPQGSQFIARVFCVDDRVTSIESSGKAIQLEKEACELCAKGGLRLHTFVSNKSAILVSRLNDASLRTFPYVAIAVVNSCPLTVDNLNDPSSLMPLTLNHLITTKSATVLPPPGKFERRICKDKRGGVKCNISLNSSGVDGKESISTTSQQGSSTKRNLQIGDIVMDMEETLSQWKLGRVSKTVTDSDGQVIRAKILLGEKKRVNA
ncbi:hypothetical protein AOLI_G00292540 [Acnodon oligacanthus]